MHPMSQTRKSQNPKQHQKKTNMSSKVEQTVAFETESEPTNDSTELTRP